DGGPLVASRGLLLEAWRALVSAPPRRTAAGWTGVALRTLAVGVGPTPGGGGSCRMPSRADGRGWRARLARSSAGAFAPRRGGARVPWRRAGAARRPPAGRPARGAGRRWRPPRLSSPTP